MSSPFKKIELKYSARIWSEISQKAQNVLGQASLKQSILDLSNKYQKTEVDQSQIWNVPLLTHAYLSYFMPLNALRILYVFQECQRLGLFEDTETIIDFGSGTGASEIALFEVFAENPLSITKLKTLHFFDKNKRALETHQTILSPLSANSTWKRQWHTQNPKVKGPSSMSLFSYSLTEHDHFPTDLFETDTLVILEPSIQKISRRLQEWRTRFQDMGYHIHAPCTHELGCPLLLHSKTDWCHTRIHIALPPGLRELHETLPMKNDSLTFSYLIVSKIAPKNQMDQKPQQARVIGDTLYERGKIRQAICRNDQREFLSWLTRNGEPTPIARGAIVELPDIFEKKGEELRLSQNLKIRD